MNNLLAIAGLALVLVSAGLLLFFSFAPSIQKSRALRPIQAFDNLRRSIGLAVEQGSRLHVTLGNASITQPASASALVGLAALERITQISSVSDRPPVATSGDGTLALLSQSSIRAAYRAGNALELYNPDRGRLTGPTPFSYTAGALPVIRSEQVSSNILIGNFGSEVALLTTAANQENQFSLAGSDSLPAQAALFASAQEPLIGEELFAAPAYLNAGPMHCGSLHLQDTLRWLLIAGLVVGSILSFLGVV